MDTTRYVQPQILSQSSFACNVSYLCNFSLRPFPYNDYFICFKVPLLAHDGDSSDEDDL